MTRNHFTILRPAPSRKENLSSMAKGLGVFAAIFLVGLAATAWRLV